MFAFLPPQASGDRRKVNLYGRAKWCSDIPGTSLERPEDYDASSRHIDAPVTPSILCYRSTETRFDFLRERASLMAVFSLYARYITPRARARIRRELLGGNSFPPSEALMKFREKEEKEEEEEEGVASRESEWIYSGILYKQPWSS
ncbi:uncharacterized protein [Prorops nasuta]|uniref:uncharacterized protein n=1 Tax=Prorops nasuta TaxID=863751 RepID=UPI0034CF6B1D